MSARIAHQLDVYACSPQSPVARGDEVEGRTVIGFTFDHDPPAGEPGDRLLLDGDQDLPRPPARPVPSVLDPSSVDITRCGPTPADGLDEDALTVPPPGLRAGYERVVDGMGDHGGLLRGVLDELAKREHSTWLVGGAVRDLLADGAEAQVHDLDFTGTAGPGELNEVAFWRRRRRDGFGDYDWRVSPQLVWSISPQEFPQRRVMEYRPLALDGFAFPAYGGSLATDAGTRDLTVNALYYDPRRGVVADPTGLGHTHLRAVPLVMAIAYRDDAPVACACVILRCLKFGLRWPDADIDGATKWIGGLPADLTARIPAEGWPRILTTWASCVQPRHRDTGQKDLARRLGPVAAALVAAILERTA
ncbi:hypothetical protein ACFV0T_37525 [Streptomyces sp. NPDC059582]|uniref:hypothetical protein n=1 Tax=Streptomyces sp. NPDC059582 TaxID=3346875 RepID=UPI0036A0A808